mmetsp:Transcript_13361/g.32464  ORF Transcript_13361/g.32464 Transcript_13361/m.32464 type:complete len:204 (-) Transcript_13361:7-618(-)
MGEELAADGVLEDEVEVVLVLERRVYVHDEGERQRLQNLPLAQDVLQLLRLQHQRLGQHLERIEPSSLLMLHQPHPPETARAECCLRFKIRELGTLKLLALRLLLRKILRVELDGNFVGGLDLGGLFKQTHRSERVPRRCPWGTSRRAGLAVLGAPRPGCTATSAPTTPAPAAIRFLPCVALAGVPRQQLGPPPSVRRRSAGS